MKPLLQGASRHNSFAWTLCWVLLSVQLCMGESKYSDPYLYPVLFTLKLTSAIEIGGSYECKN